MKVFILTSQSDHYRGVFNSRKEAEQYAMDWDVEHFGITVDILPNHLEDEIESLKIQLNATQKLLEKSQEAIRGLLDSL